MNFIEIQEPSHCGHNHDQVPAIGIDLGTTNSLIAHAINQSAAIIADENGNKLQPSVVEFLPNGEKNVANSAKNLPEAIRISSIKRLMGKGYTDLANIDYPYKHLIQPNSMNLNILGSNYSPCEISAIILEKLKAIAQKHLHTEVSKCVITVPAYFDDGARNLTKEAAKLAGLDAMRLINEPTAAALAYGLEKITYGTYLIYDLGGGTFDASILNIEKGIFQVLSTAGDVLLGGDDVDYRIANYFLNQTKLDKDNIDYNHLVKLCKKAKENLSSSPSYEVEFAGYKLSLTKENLKEIAKDLVAKTIEICKSALDDAGLKPSQIHEVILVGGSTRLELVTETLTEFFKRSPLCKINPDEVVAIGAALLADSLINGSDNLLLDVTPLSLGVEIMGEMVEKLIPRNTPIPVSVSQEFTTYQDGQTAMKFHILQGEREMVKDLRSLANFELRGIPPLKAGVGRVEVNFSIDADGILTVKALEKTTQTSQKIIVKPTFGLKFDDVEEMIMDSIHNAEEDIYLKAFTELKVEALGRVMSVENALKNDRDIVTDEEFKSITAQLALIKKLCDDENKAQLEVEIDALETLIKPFVDKQINKYLQSSLKGQEISSIRNSLKDAEK